MLNRIQGKDKIVWNFRLFWSPDRQVIFFWNDEKSQMGKVEYTKEQTMHINKLKDKMRKIASKKDYRKSYLTDLSFPLEKNYWFD